MRLEKHLSHNLLFTDHDLSTQEGSIEKKVTKPNLPGIKCYGEYNLIGKIKAYFNLAFKQVIEIEGVGAVVQYIDARDLAKWRVTALKEDKSISENEIKDALTSIKDEIKRNKEEPIGKEINSTETELTEFYEEDDNDKDGL